MVAPDLPGRLATLSQALDGALAVVTGRPLDEVDAFLAPTLLAGAGVHGLQLRDATGARVAVEAPDALDDVRVALQAFAQRHAGILLEDKGVALALHHRAAPHLAEAAATAVRDAAAGHAGLEVLSGKAVHEVRPVGVHKGTAIARLLTTRPFVGRRPVFVGDDTTDEDGFATVQRAGGLGIKIGDGPTVAHARLPDPDAVRAWLAHQAAALTAAEG